MSRNQNFLSIFLILIIFSIKSKYYLQSSSNSNNSPNFIFILADDQGWNGTSVQMMNSEPLSKSDYHYTPNLEILAQRGIRFSNAYASAPVCAGYALVYLFTGVQSSTSSKLSELGEDQPHCPLLLFSDNRNPV